MALKLDPKLWQNPEMKLIGQVLDAQKGATRLVGGAVRDMIVCNPSTDIDLATCLLPEDVMARLASAKIKAVPTGIAHGTVTAILSSGPVEITTLRRDVSTDGRRATVAYTDDWQGDAARRDFTINAMSADLMTGEIHDYFGGADDLAAGIVRFIGDPLTRIAEDHLRILRFFRFQARYGKGEPDEASLSACAARANDLMTLSRERIADELQKLLSLRDPSPIFSVMQAHGIWKPVLPEIRDDVLESLRNLVAFESAQAIAPDPIRRMAALFPAAPSLLTAIATRLKLSSAKRKRLETAAMRNDGDAENPRALAYRLGVESATDCLLLLGRDTSSIRAWTPPPFPLSGGAIVARGIKAGPEVARLLRLAEDRWVAEGFPDEARAEAIADEIVKTCLKQG